MTKEQIELIVNEVLSRINSQVLLILTNSRGYHYEIYTRLSTCQATSFTTVISEEAQSAHCANRWGKISRVTTYSPQLLAEISTFHSILIPFLDIKTLGKVANGIIDDSTTEIISQGLLRGVNVIAFDYNCNPDSELNAIIGLNNNAGYNQLIRDNMRKVSGYGIAFLSVGEFERHLASPTAISCSTQPCSPQSVEQMDKYITLQDLLHKRVTTVTHGMKLTDLAAEYIKESSRGSRGA